MNLNIFDNLNIITLKKLDNNTICYLTKIDNVKIYFLLEFTANNDIFNLIKLPSGFVDGIVDLKKKTLNFAIKKKC